MSEAILVVGAAIVDNAELPRTLLAARRNSPQEVAGRWEFPGGKVESGESPEAALRRELVEELGVDIALGDELMGPQTYGEGVHGGVIGPAWPLPSPRDGTPMAMRVWLAQIMSGDPQPLEDHDELRVLAPGHWRDVPWLDADIPIVDALVSYAIQRNRAQWC